jgi:hypothetical protein
LARQRHEQLAQLAAASTAQSCAQEFAADPGTAAEKKPV